MNLVPFPKQWECHQHILNKTGFGKQVQGVGIRYDVQIWIMIENEIYCFVNGFLSGILVKRLVTS